MNKNNLNTIVNAVSFTVLSLLAATGAIMRSVLPPGSGHFSTLWGMDRHEWGDVHFWIAVTLLCTLATHLFLHWHWIVNVVRGRRREAAGIRVALAVVVVLMLAGLVATPFFSPIESKNETPPHKMRSGHTDNIPLRIDGYAAWRQMPETTAIPDKSRFPQLDIAKPTHSEWDLT